MDKLHDGVCSDCFCTVPGENALSNIVPMNYFNNCYSLSGN